MGATMIKLPTVATLIQMMYDLYPGIQDTRIEFGFEHPVVAVGVVLLGAAMLGTIDLPRLERFTKYSPQFIAAIAFNMQNNKLWLNGRYDTSTWLHDDGSIEDRGLINHVAIAYGDRHVSAVDGEINTDPCQIFWEEHRRNYFVQTAFVVPLEWFAVQNLDRCCSCVFQLRRKCAMRVGHHQNDEQRETELDLSILAGQDEMIGQIVG